jgi:hypothetical protein
MCVVLNIDFEDMKIRTEALRYTVKNIHSADNAYNFDIEFSSTFLDSHLVIFGENENQAKDNFISFMEANKYDYGSITNITPLGRIYLESFG